MLYKTLLFGLLVFVRPSLMHDYTAKISLSSRHGTAILLIGGAYYLYILSRD
jgi:hypothetical protein